MCGIVAVVMVLLLIKECLDVEWPQHGSGGSCPFGDMAFFTIVLLPGFHIVCIPLMIGAVITIQHAPDSNGGSPHYRVTRALGTHEQFANSKISRFCDHCQSCATRLQQIPNFLAKRS